MALAAAVLSRVKLATEKIAGGCESRDFRGDEYVANQDSKRRMNQPRTAKSNSARVAGVLLAVAIAGLPVLAAVQNLPARELVLSQTPHRALFAVDFEGDRGIAVGAAGAIFGSNDAGKTWTREAKPSTRQSLLGVAIQGERRLVVGQSGTVLTQNGAAAWQSVDPGVTTRLLAVAMNASGLAVAVGQFGTILRSQDYGASWQTEEMDWMSIFGEGLQPHLYAVEVRDDATVTVAGELGSILRRNFDKAESWRVLRIAPIAEDVPMDAKASIFDLAIRADGIGYAVGQAGLILRTADRGETWTQVGSGTGAILLGVTALDGGKVMITGMREMLMSQDDGQSFARLAGADVSPYWYSGIAHTQAQSAIVFVGEAGRIIRSPVN